MSKVCYLFDGQGSFKPGMGKNIYQKYDIVKEVFRDFNKVLSGERVENYCFGAQSLKIRHDNSMIQLAITAINLAYARILKEKGAQSELNLGHSLGEVSAVIYSGTVSLEDGVRMVRKRGQLMQKIAEKSDGDMMAVMQMEPDDLENYLDIFNNKNKASVRIANINSPAQVVVSGRESELFDLKKAIVSEKTRVTVKILNVGGPWHHPMLSEISGEFREFLNTLNFRSPKKRFYSVTLLKESKDPQEIKDSLVKQLTHRVYWLKAVRDLIREEDYEFIEMGPGKILKNLMMKTDRNVHIKCASFLV